VMRMGQVELVGPPLADSTDPARLWAAPERPGPWANWLMAVFDGFLARDVGTGRPSLSNRISNVRGSRCQHNP